MNYLNRNFLDQLLVTTWKIPILIIHTIAFSSVDQSLMDTITKMTLNIAQPKHIARTAAFKELLKYYEYYLLS